MKGFFELANKRESCRSYINKPVEREKLEYMINAARLAPSACNSQPWHFTAVTGVKAQETAKHLQGMGINKFTEKCPAFIIINEEKATLMASLNDIIADNQHYAKIDIGFATAHLCYAAIDVELSTCIIGVFDEEKLKDLLSIASSKRIRLVIAVGYSTGKELYIKSRKELIEIATFID
jgi:nitroreductase